MDMILTTNETQKNLQCTRNMPEFGFVEQNSNGPFTQLYHACPFLLHGTTTSLLSGLKGWPDPTFTCTCAHKLIPAQDKHSWHGSGM